MCKNLRVNFNSKNFAVKCQLFNPESQVNVVKCSNIVLYKFFFSSLGSSPSLHLLVINCIKHLNL